MNDVISLLLPTRQRPSELSRLVASINATVTRPDLIEMVTWVDEGDNSYDNLEIPIDRKVIRGPRVHDDGLVNLSAKWNACYDACGGDIVLHAGDDIVMRTHGWDDVVRQAFGEVPDKILFAYGDDLYQPQTFGTHGFVHRRWIETVGYWLPPYFSSDYNDSFLNAVSEKIDRHRFIPIVTEHMHWCAGKAEIDQNTAERLARHDENRPQDLYFSPKVQAEIQEAADKLRAVMQ